MRQRAHSYSLVTAFVALCMGLVPSQWALEAAAQTLPVDPAIRSGTLENGLRYIVRSNDQPPGRIGFYLHVSTGSLNETERQRGIAHYLEHLAFNGSDNFPPGSVIPMFQSMGLSFGQHQNAFTSFDQTVYQLMLPDTKPENVSKALLFLADVGGRLKLLPEEIEKERQIIIEEKRTRAGGMQRIADYVIERRMPGSLVGQRVPIGTEQTILTMSEGDFRDYYSRWYMPSNMTLLAVGDMPEEAMIAAITSAFGPLPGKGDMPKDQDPIVKPIEASRAIVASDSEVVTAQLQIYKYEPPLPPVDTYEAARRELVEGLGTELFNRRMDRKVAEGTVAFQSAGADVGDAFRAAREISVSVQGKADDWKKMLNEVAAELQRARLHGFSANEFEDVRKELLADAQRAVEREASLPSQAFLGMMVGAIADGRPITSASQDLEITIKLLGTIDLKEVNETFAKVFEPKAVTFIATLPSRVDVPTEADLVKIGEAALNVKPEAEGDAARATSLMATLPTPGKIAETTTHDGANVASAWLSNGVRVHHRFMDYRKDEAIFTVMIPGGELVETEADRGIAQAAGWALSRPATSTLSSTQIRDLLTGKKVGVTARVNFDQVGITISGNPADLETGLQLAHLLLTDAVLEPAALKLWKDGQQRLREARQKQPELVFGDLINSTLYPSDIRRQPLTEAQVDRVTPEQVRSWLQKQLATQPIEVSIVGDMPRERAMELAAQYFGSLPTRNRISDAALDDLRTIARPSGPMLQSKKIDTPTDKAMFLSGFFGPDQAELEEARAMLLASRVLSTRMIEKVREDKALAYAPQAQFSPGRELPGFGTFVLITQTSPAKVSTLQGVVEELYSDFASKGPTDEELSVAKKQIATNLDEQMREPSFWSRTLSGLEYRGRTLDDVTGDSAAIDALTPTRVREIFAKHYQPASRMTVWVEPANPPAIPEPAPAKEPTKPAQKP